MYTGIVVNKFLALLPAYIAHKRKTSHLISFQAGDEETFRRFIGEGFQATSVSTMGVEGTGQ